MFFILGEKVQGNYNVRVTLYLFYVPEENVITSSYTNGRWNLADSRAFDDIQVDISSTAQNIASHLSKRYFRIYTMTSY